MIVDFDDFGEDCVISDQCQTRDCRKELEKLKEINPNFKVTLFAVPAKMTEELYGWAHKNKDWVELVQHGYFHNSNYECEKMTKEECLDILRARFKGFKAPGWQISDGCYEAIKESGMWIADQAYNDERRPDDLPCYKVGEDSYHGHTWDCCGNGITEDWDNLVSAISDEDNFQFISEAL